MGRLVLIITLLFSVTAIYSEAHAGGAGNPALLGVDAADRATRGAGYLHDWSAYRHAQLGD